MTVPVRRSLVCANAILLTAVVGQAHATSLADAVAQAYRSNPALQIQRSQLRALDEEYVQAEAPYRPTISIGVTGQYEFQRERPGPYQPAIGVNENTLTAGLSASQILYNGGRTAAGVSAAEADILSGREQLRYVEGNTMLGVISAYAAVLRDQDIFAARRTAVEAYQAQVDETKARFGAGDVTRTDVEQAESQLASARSDLANAQGTLEASRAAYVAVVGDNPGQLQPPPPLPGVPANVDDAFAIATDNNPQVLGALFDEKASRARVREEKAQNMPSLSAQAFYGAAGPATPYESRNFLENAGVTVSLAMPLFTGGLNSANIRQAQEQNVSKRLQIENVKRGVTQAVATDWNSISAADRASVSDEAARARADGSARGMRIEYRAGLRSTLEVLTEDERLEAARIAVATDAYDDYVARAALLNAMGRLQVIDFTQGVPAYNPIRNFRRVRNIGATPLDGVLAVADHIGEPGAGPAPSARTPAVSTRPEIIETNPTTSGALPFVSESPITPSGSTAPSLRGPL